MEKASAPLEAETAPAPKAAKRPLGKKLLILIMIVVVVVVLAGAAVVGLMLLRKGSASDEVGSIGPATALVDLSRPPTFAALDPFVVNLSPEEGERYLQVVMALRVADAKTADSLKGFMPEIRHRINLLLANRLPSELATMDGRLALADQIADEVNQVLGAPPAHTSADGSPTGPIRAVLFNSFIVQ